ncbi:hypothetical protein V2J09_009485, partial [Rumex salicifolius]
RVQKRNIKRVKHLTDQPPHLCIWVGSWEYFERWTRVGLLYPTVEPYLLLSCSAAHFPYPPVFISAFCNSQPFFSPNSVENHPILPFDSRLKMACATSYSSTSTWSMANLRSALPSIPPQRTPMAALSSSFPSLLPRLRLTHPASKQQTPQATGFASLCSLFTPLGFNRFENDFIGISNGSKFFAMRHGRKVPKLNRPPDQRKALLRGLTTQLLKYGRIKTTRARASALRKYIDKMITLAKDGSLHKRRQALGFIYEKQIVHALFAEVQDRYGGREGGYTRVIRTLPRRGDNAPMAYIELV